MIALKNPPKDIQEGTENHVAMILNALDSGDPLEAGYLASDLLDQLVCKSLVVTMRVAPLDHQQIAQREAEIRKEAYEQGFREGCAAGVVTSRKELVAKIVEAIR